jgi:hypothetical protein
MAAFHRQLSARRRVGVELVAEGDLDEAVGVEGGLVEGIDDAVDVGEVGVAAFAGDGVVDGTGAKDGFVEVGGVATRRLAAKKKRRLEHPISVSDFVQT